MHKDQHWPHDPGERSPFFFAPPPFTSLADSLPNVPALIATRLQLELLLQEPSIDLGAVARVILSDPGATLQILRLIGEEYTSDEDRPTRIEDCIASLNLERCYDTICASSLPQDSDILGKWEHFRLVAECARELAGVFDDFAPEEAYVVGLLHQVGKFPHLLGWKTTDESSSEQHAIGMMLADYWHLPAYLLTAIREQHEPLHSPRWAEILHMAETLADQAENGFGE